MNEPNRNVTIEEAKNIAYKFQDKIDALPYDRDIKMSMVIDKDNYTAGEIAAIIMLGLTLFDRKNER